MWACALLVLTSGYNWVFPSNGGDSQPEAADSNEYVFIYDISTSVPVQKQVVQIPNTFNGIVFDPNGWAFYVSGGVNDMVHIITRNAGGIWGEQSGNTLALGHSSGNGLGLPPDPANTGVNEMVGVKPCASGVAISRDGKTLVVANYYNDSITVFKGGYGKWSKGQELDLRPGKTDPSQAGVPGGEYPFWVAVKGKGATATAYVSSIRDREIVVVDLQGAPKVKTRIPVKGQPNKMTLNAAQSLLYVVEDQTDTIDVIDTSTNKIVGTIPVIVGLPTNLGKYRGANPNSVTLSPDEKQLYVTNGNLNCVGVVALNDTKTGGQVVGLIPTGWYPNSVSIKNFRRDGKDDGKSVYMYVVNGKSPTGANPGMRYSYGPPTHTNGFASNQYNPQLIKAGFQTYLRPNLAQLATLTEQVAANNRFASTVSPEDKRVMAAVRKGIKHVIYIIKENRCYDQILGDLESGNGDPDLAEFGEWLTPNEHNLARKFVTLDNFYDTAEVSIDGWPWTTAARAPQVVEQQYLLAYKGALSDDSSGPNRSVNVAIPTLKERQAADPFTSDDPDVLPGQTDTGAPDGPDNEVNTGYLWDQALRAHLTVRNYGFFIDCTRYFTPPDDNRTIPLERYPYSVGLQVAYPASVSLTPHTDVFFRGFDNAFPDFYRYQEWEREFDTKYANAGGTELPALTLVRFMHDHTGQFDTAIDGVNTPELMQADNDYAVGLLIEKISKSRYANNTLIFVIEDDSQDGGDHVDSHRSVAFVAGAYVKRGQLVSTQFNTIDFVRTIEEVLGLKPMNLNDALARPMADIFRTTPKPWSFTATPAPILYGTQLPLPSKAANLIVPKSRHDAAYWAQVTKGMDFTSEDRFDFAAYNRILWKGIMGDTPYPAKATGLDLRQHREELLARYQQSLKQKAAQETKAAAD
jgi:DNA-binding beta-propeller fold protein YncE